MEDGAVVEAVFALLAADRVGPLAFAFGEFGEVGYGFGRFFFEEAADDGAFRSIDDGVSTGLTRHGFLSISRCEGKMPSRQPARRRATCSATLERLQVRRAFSQQAWLLLLPAAWLPAQLRPWR